ncbi:heavy metal-associated isoprenylated plant protein 19 [Diospyros lotus]|uniref:heavy metal-associated isoprenylated plant protein 19 n=1 Tax=Diospyros lotus TaxID=55363 RepID=UPI002250CC12|nr:heavy metal-associated isoprenylated plant protein 19 [Diospyros lotus]
MADQSEGEEDEVVVVEFKVSMYCNSCERTVAKAISKIKGVEKFSTDMVRHRVVVTGTMNPEKVVRKLKKKTGKRVEVVIDKDDDSNDSTTGEEHDSALPNSAMARSLLLGHGGCALDTMLSDENANACSFFQFLKLKLMRSEKAEFTVTGISMESFRWAVEQRRLKGW